MTVLAFGPTDGDMQVQSSEVFEDMLEGACDRLVEGTVTLTL